MRALFKRSLPARCAAVVLAAAAVLGLVQAAVAASGDGLTLRWLLFGDDPAPVLSPAAAVPPRHRQARRIWAASRTRPLRIAVGRAKRRKRFAVAPSRRRTVAGPAKRHSVVASLPKLVVLPKVAPPAVVSIFEDRTLRPGDAVMMEDGIHIFRPSQAWPHRPADFVRLALATTLTWHLRQTFDELDRNPPSRWAMNGTAG